MTSGHLRERAGTSLIEVLVVMVVLVVGILVVLRSYPAGNASLRHAENVSIAGRLAQQEMEFWKNHAANLPEGVLALRDIDGDGVLDPDPYMLPGPPMNDTNATAFRQIVGEVTRVPVGTYLDLPGGDDVASIYVLGFSPISATWIKDDDARDVPGNISVYGGNMRGIRLDKEDEPDPARWLGTRYAIDYSARMICFPQIAVGQKVTYNISYSYYISGAPAQLRQVIARPVPVSGGDQWISLPDENGGDLDPKAVIDEGSETVARGFKYLALNENWSIDPPDPYEYKLIDSTNLPLAVVGMLAFNPAGHSYQETTEQGARALEAHITYELLNPQIMHEDRMVPRSAPYKVKLTLRYIKQRGETAQTDGSIYRGLGDGKMAVDFGSGLVVPDVLVVNPGTGAKIDPASYSIDHKTGTIEFPPNGVVTVMMPDPNEEPKSDNIAGRNLRFYYQAENDWSVQLHKAYEQYSERAYTVPYTMIHKQFMVSGPTLYFSPCEAGKTVAVTYKWNAADLKTQAGETHQISAETVPPGFCFINLNQVPAEIVSVVGVSVKARALWRSRQDKERWLHVDLDSSLTRLPTEL
ncbi:MAG: hypothetical protein Q7T82_14135 [Armatimonadota bacterium]|nr:hypothetical protein [Armatimonadota bacterium]